MSLPRLRFRRHPFVRLLKSERAQALPVIAFMLVALVGIAGLVVDFGNVLVTYRKLQASTDAAALAGASALPSANAASVATSYGGGSGGQNQVTTLAPVTMVSGYPKVSCLTTLKNQGMACSAPGNGNAVSVAQQVTLPLYFLRVVGKKTITLSTVATASMRGGPPTPYNVAIVVDQTLSMNITDTDCGGLSQGTCALNGIQILLQSLTPCAVDQQTCTFTNGVAANAVDRVALFAFPAMSIGTTSVDTSCTTPVPAPNSTNGYYSQAPYGNFTVPYTPWNGIPTAVPYSYPAPGASSYAPSGSGNPTYQITPFLSDYRTSDTAATLNSSSTLAKAAGAVSGCGGMLPPNYEVLFTTYYAAAIYAAQAALVAQAAQNPGTQNVLIFLSDGDANAVQKVVSNGTTYWVMPAPADGSGHYPSYVGECGQAITAAQAATAAGTHVYSVAYGSPTSGCSTDANAGTYPNITPCQTMADIASAPQYFFSDYNQSNNQSGGTPPCFSNAQPVTSLSAIFTQIAGDLTVGRLIPDNTP